MRILIFGPNGSGKGTQGAEVQKHFKVCHVESGVIFRQHIGKGTELGMKAKVYIDRGDLVPDDITIPMILERLAEADCQDGWLLDGFPRSVAQAEALEDSLKKAGMEPDIVINLSLSRDVAKQRIMGRRLCVNDNNHPNHVAFDAIKPKELEGGKLVCRVCDGELKCRPDDQDESAINKRHMIFFDEETGTTAAINYFKKLAAGNPHLKFVTVDSTPPIGVVRDSIMKQIS